MGQFSGLALPWDGTLKTFVAGKTDLEVLRSSVMWIIMTRKGERVMLPEFGSDVGPMLFDPNDDTAKAQLQYAVQDAIEIWDTRVKFLQADIKQEDHDVTVRAEFQNVEDPLAEEIISGSLKKDSLIEVGIKGDKLTFKSKK